jgi:hypothetical protein
MADPSTFDVLGTPLIVTDTNFPAAAGTKEFVDMFNQVNIDLSGPDKDCLFLFGKFPAEPQTKPDGTPFYRYGAVQAKSQALISLVQQALEQYVQDRTGDATFRMDIDGVYNCKDAQTMLAVAQESRQTGLGAVDFWPLGPTEFYYLLTQSRLFQSIIAQAIAQQGQTYGATYQGAMVVLPMKEAPGIRFKQADVPPVCAGTTPPVGPGGENQPPTCMPGYAWDPQTGTCASLAGPACPAGQVWDATAGKCVAGGTTGTGAGGGGGAGSGGKEDWWKWPLGIGAGVVGIGGLYYWYTNRS